MMTLPNEVMDKTASEFGHDTEESNRVEYDLLELGYDESKEEAKHPGAMLGLIMGVYPLIMVAFILALIGYAFFVHPIMMSPTNTTTQQNELLSKTEK